MKLSLSGVLTMFFNLVPLKIIGHLILHFLIDLFFTAKTLAQFILSSSLSLKIISSISNFFLECLFFHCYFFTWKLVLLRISYHPPASEASREGATERKNLHTPIHVTSFSSVPYCSNSMCASSKNGEMGLLSQCF